MVGSRQNILFPLMQKFASGDDEYNGISPLIKILPIQPSIDIAGVSKDSAGAVLVSCTMNLFQVNNEMNSKMYTFISSTISDSVTGSYSFRVGLGQKYCVIGFNASETLAGVTLNNLTGL